MRVAADEWEQRHAQLIAQIAYEREEIARIAARLRAPVRRVEAVQEKTAFVVRYAIVLWLPMAVLLMLRPRRGLRWVTRALGAYQTFRRFKRVVS